MGFCPLSIFGYCSEPYCVSVEGLLTSLGPIERGRAVSVTAFSYTSNDYVNCFYYRPHGSGTIHKQALVGGIFKKYNLYTQEIHQRNIH